MRIREAIATTVDRESAADEAALLRALRDRLRESYPAIPSSSLIAIARAHGRSTFPEGFLVSGRLRDLSPSGPRSLLRATARGDLAREQRLHPLFSAQYYRSVNADLAGSGVSAWLHYQVFGRLEGRSPHPLIDIKHLGAALPGVARGSVVDSYLHDRRNWVVDPGPYVDCLRFTLFGEWDGDTNPLLQIVRSQLRSHWIHERLMLVDAASDIEAQARLAGVSFLLSRNSGRNRLSSVQIWRHSAAGDKPSLTYTIVPGFMLADDDVEILTMSADAVSGDSTVVRLSTETIGLVAAAPKSTSLLLVLTGPTPRDELEALVDDVDAPTTVAPHSRAQEISLRQLRRDLRRPALTVLEHGVQARVAAEGLRIHDPIKFETATWDWSMPTNDLAIVLSEAHRLRATGDKRLRAALAAGASLCLVGERGLNSWLPQLQARATVVVDRMLINDVASFVPPARLLALPSSDEE